MEKISDIFGSMVFNDAVMRERLPKETYRQVQATMEKGKRLDDDAAQPLGHDLLKERELNAREDLQHPDGNILQ